MRVGAFELREPVPDIKGAHTMAVLRPWIDVGSAGTLAMSWLETHFGAEELGKLARPGSFFDFTRYRPTIHFKEGRRQMIIPNTLIRYAKREEGNDFLFLHILEPHMLGEVYVESVLRLMQKFSVERYCLLGGMYDMVPHTRPLIVTGGSLGTKAEHDLRRAHVQESNYEGPTTITYLISQRAPELGIETMGLIVHLPHYSQMDENYMGKLRLMEVLSSLYDVPIDQADIDKAERQSKELSEAVDKEPPLKSVIAQLESHYDARAKIEKEEEMPQLSPEVERFLQDINRRFTEN
jgi:hypothetical protein